MLSVHRPYWGQKRAMVFAVFAKEFGIFVDQNQCVGRSKQAHCAQEAVMTTVEQNTSNLKLNSFPVLPYT